MFLNNFFPHKPIMLVFKLFLINYYQVLGLTEIFQPGDILPVKILSVSEESKSLMVTSDPKIINSNLSYDAIDKDLILTGNVKSKEDHGFIIDFGIDKVLGFLKFDKVQKIDFINVHHLNTK